MSCNRQWSKRVTWQASGVWPDGKILLCVIGALLSVESVYANPDGGTVVHGQVTFDSATPGELNITNSPDAIINWQNFSIAQNEITRFIQENGQSAVLNRVIGGDTSEILGSLASNGKVLLINPNGIVFGAGAQIDTQSLIASSLNLSDSDFLKGNYHFVAGSHSGNIVNEGIIRAGQDGNIILIAPAITNSGILKTEGGQLLLVAGQELLLTSLDTPGIRFQFQAPSNAVLNVGKLLADGGMVDIFAGTIHQSGEISADAINVDKQGRIQLVAQGDISITGSGQLHANNATGSAGSVLVDSQHGTVTLAGQIATNASSGAGNGGQVQVLGERVALLDNAQVSANGGQGGGEVLIGGDLHGANPAIHNAKAVYAGENTQIHANASVQGNGGKVIVWSDQHTRAYGTITAQGGQQAGNGGFIETSGKNLDVSDIKINASAANGQAGQWLLDPNNITIQAAGQNTRVKGDPNWTSEDDGGIVTSKSIEAALNQGTSVSVVTGTAGGNSEAGNITVASSITKSSGNDAGLQLKAHHNIDINAPITASSGKLDLQLTANFDGMSGGVATINKLLDLNGGTLTLNNVSQLSDTGAIRSADILVPSSAVSEWDGYLTQLGRITLQDHAKLAINRANSLLETALDSAGELTVNAFLALGGLNLQAGTLAGSGNLSISQALALNAGTVLQGQGILNTSADTVTNLTGSGSITLDKQWNNFGIINWSSPVNISASDSGATFNNFTGAAINISGDSSKELAAGIFNNHGAVNVTAGTLNLVSAGNDKGSYHVTASGNLAFSTPGSRNFVSGAMVDSENPVVFNLGVYKFLTASSYQAAKTELSNGATLLFNTGIAQNLTDITINGATLGGGDALNVSGILNLADARLSKGGLLTTLAGSTTYLQGDSATRLNKHWTNAGTLNWTGGSLVDSDQVAVFNNTAGTINIGSAESPATQNFVLDMVRFNNQGTVSLLGGTLTVANPGTDTGRYQVSGTGQLQFLDGIRVFDQAQIQSPNTVTFQGGKNYFRNAAVYQAAQTEVLDGATLNFSGNGALSLANLTLDGGTLEGSDPVTISNHFNFHSGTLTGEMLTTAATATTVLADKNSAFLGKNWENFGVVTWNGTGVVENPANHLSSFTNKSGGIFNIAAATSDALLTLGLNRFSNDGTVNLSKGVLKITSPGDDTGHYVVADQAQLQFANSGTRNFNAAVIDSPASVYFNGGGKINFNQGTQYNAQNTVIDATRVALNTGAAVQLPMLTIKNSGFLSSSDAIEVTNQLDFLSGFITGANTANITTKAGSAVNLNENGAFLALDWNNYGTANLISSGIAATLPRIPNFPVYHWNNFGTVFWQDDVIPTNAFSQFIIATNQPGGVYNISNPDTNSIREIALGGFNNQGTVNLSAGILSIISSGTDTGSYQVTGSGQLQFGGAERTFNGATLSSSNPITFGDGAVLNFIGDSVVDAPETLISDATLNINSALSVNKVTLANGTINNNSSFNTAGEFVWSGGTVAGTGSYHFKNGFAYSGGTMSAKGVVEIDGGDNNINLPAMPSIGRLHVTTSGQITLLGDLNASAQETAILLAAEKLVSTKEALQLATPNGHWLLYSLAPGLNQLSGLTADFKHYGCDLAQCADGFKVATAQGNGLLYQTIPIITVTPDKTSNRYGDDGVFTASYSGFIDGDTAQSAGIGGTALFAIGGAQSGSGHYRAGSHELSYESGLTNQLGYQFKDDASSLLEWLITPRDLAIAANATEKTYGGLDPLLGYTASGLLAGDSLSGSLRRDTGENVGQYQINQGSLAASSDYRLAYTAASLTISPKDLDIFADPKRKLFGETDPLLTYRSQGLINGDTLFGQLQRAPGENVGLYRINQGSLTASPNYKVTYVGADLTISPSPQQPEPPLEVQQQSGQQQNQVIVLTQQNTFDSDLQNSITNNTPQSSGNAPTGGSGSGQKQSKQCQ